MDHTHRFDGKSGIYEKIRPQSADGLFACFRDTLKIPADSVFAAVGAGTGFFTRQLLSCAIRSLRQSRTATCAKRRKEPFVTTRGFAPSAARSIRPFTAILAASATKNVGRFSTAHARSIAPTTAGSMTAGSTSTARCPRPTL